MTRIVLIVEYDGTDYCGFQAQSCQPTIQSSIEAAWYKLTGERHRLSAASRTDTGVHAKGQVVSIRTFSALSPAVMVKGLNHYLPEDIAVKTACLVDDDFDVRCRAVSREYRYSILNSENRSPIVRRFAYHVPRPLDTGAMQTASRTLVGEHDFASFASRIKGSKIGSTVRKVLCAGVRRDGDLIVFDVVAKSFLPHQVRNTVGALLQVGAGSMSMDEFYGIIEAKKVGLARPAVPAGGLCLMRVNYAGSFGEN